MAAVNAPTWQAASSMVAACPPPTGTPATDTIAAPPLADAGWAMASVRPIVRIVQ